MFMDQGENIGKIIAKLKDRTQAEDEKEDANFGGTETEDSIADPHNASSQQSDKLQAKITDDQKIERMEKHIASLIKKAKDSSAVSSLIRGYLFAFQSLNAAADRLEMLLKKQRSQK
jgi:hypothetical protein